MVPVLKYSSILVQRYRDKHTDLQVVNLFALDIGSPEGIAVDWAARNIYWTDSMKDTIEVASLDSKIRRVLVNTDLVNPRGIAVHPSRGYVYVVPTVYTQRNASFILYILIHLF